MITATGLSNTVIFSEFISAARTKRSPRGCTRSTPTTDAGTAATPLPQIVANCKKAAQTGQTLAAANKGGEWLDHNTGKGGGYSHIMTPNLPACQFSGGSSVRLHFPPTSVCVSSKHAGGVNVGFLDGSVKFIKDSVSQTTWWAIASMAGGGGEVVSVADSLLIAGSVQDDRRRSPCVDPAIRALGVVPVRLLKNAAHIANIIESGSLRDAFDLQVGLGKHLLDAVELSVEDLFLEWSGLVAAP